MPPLARPTQDVPGVHPLDMGSSEEAEARIDRLVSHFSHREVPMWTGDLRSHSDARLDDARDRAFQAADDAGRGETTNAAIARIERAYAMRAADAGYWTGLYAVNPPWDAASRAQSQMVVEDLVIATIVEDLVSDSVADPLRADGERLLRLSSPEMDDDDSQPPVEPFAGPLVFTTRWIAIGFLVLLVVGLLVGGTFGWEGLVALLLIGGVLLILRRIVNPTESGGSS